MSIKRKRLVWLLVLGLLVVWQTLNFTGFCYAEKRWLTPEKIKYRLAWTGWRDMTPIPSDKEIEKQAYANGRLDTVSVRSFTPWADKITTGGTFNTILNRFFGSYYYDANSTAEIDKNRQTDEYFGKEYFFVVNACGNKSYSKYSEQLDKKEYLKRLEIRKKSRVQ